MQHPFKHGCIVKRRLSCRTCNKVTFFHHSPFFHYIFSDTATSALHTLVVTELPSEPKIVKDASQPESSDPTPSAKHSGTDIDMWKEKTVKTKSATQKEKILSSAPNKRINDDSKVTERKEGEVQNSKYKQKKNRVRETGSTVRKVKKYQIRASSSRSRQLRRIQRKHKKQNGK